MDLLFQFKIKIMTSQLQVGLNTLDWMEEFEILIKELDDFFFLIFFFCFFFKKKGKPRRYN